MRRIVIRPIAASLAVAVVLFATGCSKQPKPEVSAAAQAEAAALVEEAKFALSIREFARAEELAQRGLRLHEDKPEYWATLGMARRRQDNTSGAREAYEHALSLHKERYMAKKAPEELIQQAFVLALLGKRDEALKVLETGLKEHPDHEVLKVFASPRGLPRTFQTDEFKAIAL